MSLRDRLVREEYVGANRCWPCTALNGAIVAVVALALALVWTPLAVVAAGLGGAAIAYRGYVVPGTPRFAPRLAKRLPFSFGHSERSPTRSTTDGANRGPDERGGEAGADPDAAATDSDSTDGDAVFDALRDAGVLVGSDADVALDEAFRTAWRERMRDVRSGDVVAAVGETRPNAVVERQIDESGDEWVVVGAGTPDESWLAPAVAVADVAAVDALAKYGVPRESALPAASALRAFLERCPSCDGELAWETEGCCGGYGPDGPDRLLACQACGAAVFAE
ncbi:hypothetical protein GCM10009037_12790 [Halarchaeum grantii]|uniref:Uncharacterized protein n=1 Tax=Halarchaeum grantii TaxID=1193105 RepID=A0A830FBL9_9EURY|nr:hypothetical protein [Halarchaeum grantii]GGL30535.1 hypothetical protein GCM10009037_12790 [Halarchaeum grantii]